MSDFHQPPMPYKPETAPALDPARWMRTPPQALSPVYDIPAEPEDAAGASEFFASLARHKTKIAVCAVAGVAIGLAIAAMTRPTYQAKTSLQIEDFHDVPLLSPMSVSQTLPGTTVESYLQNEVKLLESDTLASRVADKLGDQLSAPKPRWWTPIVAAVRDRLNFLPRYAKTPEQKRIEAVQNAMTVRTSLQSEVLDLLYDAPNPQLAAAGANAAANEFIDMNREARSQTIAESTSWLTKQAADLNAKLEADTQHLQDFATSAGLVFAGADDTLAQDRMKQLQTALVQAETDRAAKESRYDAVNGSGTLLPTAAPVDPVQQYQSDLQNMRKQLSELRTIYTANHPKVVAMQAQIKEMEQGLNDMRKDSLARVKTEYTAAAGLEQMLSSAQKKELDTVERQMSQQRHYEVMKSEVDTTRRLYESVLENLKQAGAASSLRSTNVRVIDAAMAPSAPYSPNLPLNSAIGLAFGTLGGIALVLMQGRNNKVTRPGEAALFNVPELGVIPSARHGWPGRPHRLLAFGRKSEPGLVTWTHDSSPMSESFRATLNSILFGTFISTNNGHGERPRGRILTITSFDPMAGKTTVLANLAVASAERKLRVLVIDGDLRRPRLHSLFNLANDWGLTDVLEQSQVGDFARTAPLESLVRPTHISNVWVLPSGPGNAAIPSLLYSAGLRALFQRLRAEFDLIYVDSPPMMLYSDARLLGRMSDGLVMVVRANTRSRDELRMVYARLMEDRIRVLGTVLNQWEMDSSRTREYGRTVSPAAGRRTTITGRRVAGF
jgi:polysaccharide biosynthesis transport protein